MNIEFTSKSPYKSYFKVFLFFEETKTNKILKKFKIKKPKLLDDFQKLDDEIFNFIENDEYIICVGLGKKRDMNIDKLRNIFNNLKRFIKNFDKKMEKQILFKLENGDEHFYLDQILLINEIYYKFDKYKTNKKSKKKRNNLHNKTNKLKKENKIYIHIEKKLLNKFRNIPKLITSINLCKNLGDEPSNILHPEYYLKIVQDLGKKSGFNVKVIDEKEMKKLGMNLFLSVSNGSIYPPYLVEITPKSINLKKEKTVLIGKGITYDSGGLSLKKTEHMYNMKSDMIGSAVVLGIINYLSEIESEENVTGYLAIAENMIGSNATRPGDVVESLGGKYVEIMNTDAEGRLVLGDTITYSRKLKPKIIIDIATLTGQQENLSCSLFANIMSNNDELSKKLIEIGDKNSERLIKLPLYQEFVNNTKSDITDIKNSNYRCKSSIIHAGAFLSNFVEDYNVKWCHLDIAGPGFISNKTTGFGIRLLGDFFNTLYK